MESESEESLDHKIDMNKTITILGLLSRIEVSILRLAFIFPDLWKRIGVYQLFRKNMQKVTFLSACSWKASEQGGGGTLHLEKFGSEKILPNLGKISWSKKTFGDQLCIPSRTYYQKKHSGVRTPSRSYGCFSFLSHSQLGRQSDSLCKLTSGFLGKT